MFEARLTNAGLLKKILESVKDLQTDANLVCTEDGILLQAMDAAHVSLITFTLLTDAFSLYTCTDTITLGVNTVVFARILKCADNTDSVLLRTVDDGKLHITFESQSGQRTSEFQMNLMEIDGEHISIPDTEYTCSVKMPSGDFTRIVRDLQAFGETTTVAVEGETVRFTATGEAGTASIIVKADKTAKAETEWTEIECGEPTAMNFALRYLSSFTKGQGIADQVTLFMTAGMPIYVTYDMGDLGSVGYYLAPKVHED
jgi:proliferating cell nuclear antigen